MSELVSVVITTHNRSRLLIKAIESVKKQTYNNIQCIVVDDASCDETEALCSNTEGISYIRIEKEDSKGGNYARNIGIKAADGKFVAFLDDDDVWFPTKIEKQYSLIKGNDDVGVVYCAMMLIFVGDNTPNRILKKTEPTLKGDLSKKILYRIPFVTSTFFVRKELLYKVGLFDEELSFWQEYELTIRLAQITTFDFVDEALVGYLIDKTDKNRLTNHYFRWRDAVEYVRNKHCVLYSNISLFGSMRYYWLVLQDAFVRAKNAKLKGFPFIKLLIFYYLLKILIFPCRIVKKKMNLWLSTII
jgi:Predicted glycosyltransferases